ncbi:CPCC family cysteine-rich protein [Streptomyces sp. NBC_01456]
MAGGANPTSLIDAQRNYEDFGACDRQGLAHVRPPAATNRSIPLGAPSISPTTPSRTGAQGRGPHDPRTARCCAGGCQPSGAATPRRTQPEPTTPERNPQGIPNRSSRPAVGRRCGRIRGCPRRAAGEPVATLCRDRSTRS